MDKINNCIQCGACAGICTASGIDDFYNPRRIIFLKSLELKGFQTEESDKLFLEELDPSSCFQCYSCSNICPKGVSPGDIIKYMREVKKEEGNDEKCVEMLREYLLDYGQSIIPESFDGVHKIWKGGWKGVIKRKGYQRPEKRNIPQKTIEEVNYLVNLSKNSDLKFTKKYNTKFEERNLKDIDHIVLFQSCCGNSHYPGVGESSKYVLDKLGISYDTSNEQTCCGGFAYYGNDISIDELVLIGARNQGLIENMGDVAISNCTSCVSSNLEVKMRLSAEKRKKVNDILSGIGNRVEGDLLLTHFQSLLYDNIDYVVDSLELDLTGLKVATHTGCHYRNFSSRPDRYRMLDEIVRATGAEVVNYPLQNSCCGGGFEKSYVGDILKVREVNYKKQKSILDVDSDVDIILVNCPGCEMTFDRNSVELSKSLPLGNVGYLHILELLALAMGADPYEVVGLKYHTAYEPLLEKFDIEPPKGKIRDILDKYILRQKHQ